ncbi:MAG: TolC family protein [Sandaracinaceae bacterium]|nr:TolC family protein [Sandaracinaceae bacterium]
MRALVSALLVLAPATAGAQPITFDRAIALSTRAPRVEGAARALETRRSGDADIGGTSQGLTVTATPGARVLSEQDQGFEGQLAITHSWNLGDLTGARRRAAAAERRVLAAERRALALLARLEAARRWIDLHRLGELARVVAEEEALASTLADATARALGAGAATGADEAEVDAHLAEVRLRALAIEGALHEASVALSFATSRPPTSRLRAAGPLPEPEVPDEVDVRVVAELPAVAVERLAAAAERAREVEVAAAYAPQVALGAQIQRESPSGVIVGAVLGLSIPLFDQGQRGRSVARGEAERRDAEHAHARLEAARDLALAVHDVEHQRREERAARELLVPALERLVERREAALRAGEGTIFALLDARRRALEARGRWIEARAARAWAEVRLWILLAELRRASEAA